MSNREFLQSRREAEYPVFIKVLKALPQDRFDYRPHERSPSAAEVVWTLPLETKACCDLVDSGRVNWKPVPPPADSNAILAAFQEHSAALDDRLQRMNDAGWQKPAQLLINDKLEREATVGEFLWYIFSTLFIAVDSSAPTFVPSAARSPLFTDPPVTIPVSRASALQTGRRGEVPSIDRSAAAAVGTLNSQPLITTFD